MCERSAFFTAFRGERATDKPLGVLIEELRLAANNIT